MTDCLCLSHNGFLTKLGYAVVDERGHSELAHWGDMCYLDNVGSVSAYERRMIFDDHILDEQYRRFLNGS